MVRPHPALTKEFPIDSLNKLSKYAKALLGLHEQGLLADPDTKLVVKWLIRTVNEGSTIYGTAHFRSAAAADFIRSQRRGRQFTSQSSYHEFCQDHSDMLRHEHIVPCEVVYQALLALDPKTEHAIVGLLAATGHRAVILMREDSTLTKLGLRQAMPDAFHHRTAGLESYYGNWMARYMALGIADGLEVKPAEGWWCARH